MRKLRRLPWRIPKSHPHQPPVAATVEPCPRVEVEEDLHDAQPEELHDAQPVAFTAGRYVYGYAPSVPRSTEIRRKVRQRSLRAIPALG